MLASVRNGASLVILLVSATYSNGETTVWLSDNATFADLDITTSAPPGTTGSFDIWIKTKHSNRLSSIGLDLITTGDAIEFIDGDIVIGTDRFRVFGPSVAQDRTMITNMGAYAGIGLDLGTGIGPGVPIDDVQLGAYRFGTVHYRIAGLGKSELQLKVGLGIFDWTLGGPNLLHLGIDDPISIPYVPGATDTIIDGRILVIPEQGSLLVSLIGGLCLSLRRGGR